jgi:hypothetical protein
MNEKFHNNLLHLQTLLSVITDNIYIGIYEKMS